MFNVQLTTSAVWNNKVLTYKALLDWNKQPSGDRLLDCFGATQSIFVNSEEKVKGRGMGKQSLLKFTNF